MVHDIHDSKYISSLKTLKPYKFIKDAENDHAGKIVWWILFVITCLFSLVYIIGTYYTYFAEPEEFIKTFSNSRMYSKINEQNKKLNEAKLKREKEM